MGDYALNPPRRVFQEEIQQPDSLLLTEAAGMNARRIFIDGLAGLARSGNGEGRELFHMLVEGLHREGVTAMFALDAPADRAGVGAAPEDFIADTIIRLGRETVRRAVVRSLEVVKSRGQEYLMGMHSFRVTNDAKDRFLAMLAHELRNPLAPIRIAMQVIDSLGDGGNPAVKKAQEVVDRQVRHLTRLLDDLLDVSRITTGKIELHREAVNLATAVASALEASRSLIQGREHGPLRCLPQETAGKAGARSF